MRDNKVIEGKIGIVIVNYNGEKYQNDALKTIYQSSYQNFEVIIVDSGSKDNSIKLAQIEYPNVHYLLQKDNIGVARGNNIGIQYAINRLGVEYILLLNNDVELEKHTIQRLVDLAGAEYVVVPKIYFYKPDNILWFAGATNMVIFYHNNHTLTSPPGCQDMTVLPMRFRVRQSRVCHAKSSKTPRGGIE